MTEHSDVHSAETNPSGRLTRWVVQKLLIGAIGLTALTTAVSVIVSRAMVPDTHALQVRIEALQRQVDLNAAKDVLDRLDTVMRAANPATTAASGAKPRTATCVTTAYEHANSSRRRPDRLYLGARWRDARQLYGTILKRLTDQLSKCGTTQGFLIG